MPHRFPTPDEAAGGLGALLLVRAAFDFPRPLQNLGASTRLDSVSKAAALFRGQRDTALSGSRGDTSDSVCLPSRGFSALGLSAEEGEGGNRKSP